MFERYELTRAKGSFLDLGRELVCDMRQSDVALVARVWRIATQDESVDAKALAGSENRANVVGGADIVGDDDNRHGISLAGTSVYGVQ